MSKATSKLWANLAINKKKAEEAKGKERPRLEYAKTPYVIERKPPSVLPELFVRLRSSPLHEITASMASAVRKKRGSAGAKYVLSMGEAFQAESLRVKSPIQVLCNLRSYFQQTGNIRLHDTGAYARLKKIAQRSKQSPTDFYWRFPPQKILQLEIERLMTNGFFKVTNESEKKLFLLWLQ